MFNHNAWAMQAKKIILFIFFMGTITVSGSNNDKNVFPREEMNLINDGDGIMRLFTTESESDINVLRRTAEELPKESMFTSEFSILCERMLVTVQNPYNNGVGIAAPQVGVNKRLIAVQRFDKEGEPFELYINPEITGHNGEKIKGPEGCLSVPGENGVVPRYHEISITYNDIKTFEERTENIAGFTAVIFQHEIDHLDGILYIDRI